MDHRVYCISSVISCLFAAVHARKHARKGDILTLIVDPIKIRKSTRDMMRKIANDSGFDHFLDLSFRIEDHESDQPTWLKQVVRSVKTKPVIRLVYDCLHNVKLKIEAIRFAKKLSLEIERLESITPSVIFTQPDLRLTKPVINIYGKAKVHIIEHGIGDYLSYRKNKLQSIPFHCLFPEALEAEKSKGINCINLFENYDFEHFASKFFEKWFPQLNGIKTPKNESGLFAIICLQPFEQFLVDETYWKEFITTCLSVIGPDKNIHWVVKPHPRQSMTVIARIKLILDSKSVNYTILDDPEILQINVEILFYFLGEYTSYLFSAFSSGSFYIPRLYPSSEVKSYYDFEILNRYNSKSPDYYKKWWKEMEVFIESGISGAEENLLQIEKQK